MTVLPHTLSTLRFALAPFVFLAIQKGYLDISILLVAVAVLTDVADGWLARRIKSPSALGSYLDVFADFGFLFAACAALALKKVYPFWLLLIMLMMFLQFVLRPKRGRLVYDPVGKYYGAVLYSVVLLTLLAPDLALAQALFLFVLFMTAASLFTRVFLARPESVRHL